MNPYRHPHRFIRRVRLCLYVAALPLVQIAACQTAIGQTALAIQPQIPGIVISAVGSAALNSLYSLLGIDSATIGSSNSTGTTGT